jgi:hypothetical protein
MRRNAFAVGVVASAVVLAVSASAPADPSPVKLDLGGGTYFPLSVTAEGTIELPYRILLQGDLGWMPAPYSNTIIDLLNAFGAINTFEQDLLKAAIQNSLVARISAGWRPFPALGLEVLAGYTLLAIGGSVTGSDVVDSYLAANGSADRTPADARRDVPLSSTLHSFHATVGWRFLLLDDHLVLRASLAYLQCFASSTSVNETPARPAEQALVGRINTELQNFLNPYYTTYVKVPILGVTAAYRF